MPAITLDLVRASSTVSVAPKHFVSRTVEKVPRVGDLKAGSVRLTAVVTNARSGNRRAPLTSLRPSRFPSHTHDYASLIRPDARRFTSSLLRNSLRCGNASLPSPVRQLFPKDSARPQRPMRLGFEAKVKAAFPDPGAGTDVYKASECLVQSVTVSATITLR